MEQNVVLKMLCRMYGIVTLTLRICCVETGRVNVGDQTIISILKKINALALQDILASEIQNVFLADCVRILSMTKPLGGLAYVTLISHGNQMKVTEYATEQYGMNVKSGIPYASVTQTNFCPAVIFVRVTTIRHGMQSNLLVLF